MLYIQYPVFHFCFCAGHVCPILDKSDKIMKAISLFLNIQCLLAYPKLCTDKVQLHYTHFSNVLYCVVIFKKTKCISHQPSAVS